MLSVSFLFGHLQVNCIKIDQKFLFLGKIVSSAEAIFRIKNSLFWFSYIHLKCFIYFKRINLNSFKNESPKLARIVGLGPAIGN